MLDQYVKQGTADALRRFGFEKEAMGLGPAGAPGVQLGAAGAGHAAPAAAAGGGGFVDKAKAFGQGQWGAAKSLAGNLHQGLGGAPDAAAGAAARGAAVGNLKTLAPSLLAGGAMFMMHRHNQAKREEQARQHAMMMGNPGMGY